MLILPAEWIIMTIFSEERGEEVEASLLNVVRDRGLWRLLNLSFGLVQKG